MRNLGTVKAWQAYHHPAYLYDPDEPSGKVHIYGLLMPGRQAEAAKKAKEEVMQDFLSRLDATPF